MNYEVKIERVVSVEINSRIDEYCDLTTFSDGKIYDVTLILENIDGNRNSENYIGVGSVAATMLSMYGCWIGENFRIISTRKDASLAWKVVAVMNNSGKIVSIRDDVNPLDV